jgi:adenylate cyclase
MTTEGFKRKLTTIFSADVAGYSRLMAEDEVATVRMLTAYREVMTSLIKQHGGRVVDSPGDNVLAEFASVVDAVQCAVSVQKEFQARNAELPENRRMEFRIGINLGDVIKEEDRIYGDGVNIAARLEALADPGGICVSKTAFDHIESKLPLGYEYLGDQTVKNIPKPVGAYRVVMEPRVTVVGEEEVEKPSLFKGRRAILAGVIAVVVVVLAVLVWRYYLRPSKPTLEPASVEKMAFPLPDKPSIAVLPFANMSGDVEQEYFSDGLSEEIITALSKIAHMFVIARNSTFTYKGKPVQVRRVAEELGVRYVLEGSVRKAEDRVRVTVQLIDALTGRHLWAERYDRDLEDIFAVQDEITKKVVTALQVELTEGEQGRVFARGTNNVEAWSLGAKAYKLRMKYSKESFAKSRELLERAIKLDPDYVFLWTSLAWNHYIESRFRWSESPAESFKLALEFNKKALTTDPEDPIAHSQLGTLSLMQRKHEKAVAECQRSVTLNPNYADGYGLLGQALLYSGRFEEAITAFKNSLRVSPVARSWVLRQLGVSYIHLGRYDEALPPLMQMLDRGRKGERAPYRETLIALIWLHTEQAQDDEAKAYATELLESFPSFTLERYAKVTSYKDPAHLERNLSALRKAGIPDKPSLPLPDKPSIAVLPFTNIGDDPKQDYFADGMTEDLITDLSKISGLFVIARNSAFTYKGKPVKVDQVSRELGVRYVLEGSVRKADDRVRINAQLIDATTGGHLWAERYDGKLGDIFALQDKVTQKIVASLAVELTSDEQENVARRGTDNVAAYDAFVQGREYYLRHTPDDMVKAATSLKRAIELDPNFPQAHALLSMTYNTSRSRRWDQDLGWSDARSLAEKHLKLAMKNPTPKVHRVAAWHYFRKGQHEKAIAEAERSLTLEPNNSKSHSAMGAALIYAGRSKEAIDFWNKAMRLDPYYPAQYLWFLGLAQLCVGQLEEAATSFERARKRKPGLSVWPLAAAYAHLGREQEAADLIAEYIKRRGWKKPTIKFVLKYYPFKDPKDRDRFAEGLRKAGLE